MGRKRPREGETEGEGEEGTGRRGPEEREGGWRREGDGDPDAAHWPTAMQTPRGRRRTVV